MTIFLFYLLINFIVISTLSAPQTNKVNAYLRKDDGMNTYRACFVPKEVNLLKSLVFDMPQCIRLIPACGKYVE
jgi:hypothetical protein